MSGTHPHELQLLDYVEEDLPAAARAEVENHVAACTECAAQVRLLRTGRQALREAPLLQAPDRVRPELPEPQAARRRVVRPSRLVAVLAPVAVVAAALVAVTSLDPSGGDEAERQGASAEPARTAQAEAGGQEESAPALDAAAPIREVAGPARAVARILRERGFDARVRDGGVEVSGATPEAVETALAGRPDGPVEVVVVP